MNGQNPLGSKIYGQVLLKPVISVKIYNRVWDGEKISMMYGMGGETPLEFEYALRLDGPIWNQSEMDY